MPFDFTLDYIKLTNNQSYTPNKKLFFVTNSPYWKYDVTVGSISQYLAKGLFGRFAPPTDSEISIERGEERNKLLKNRIIDYMNYIFYNDNFYDQVNIYFDNDHREAQFSFIKIMDDKRIGRMFTLEYLKIIDTNNYMDYFLREIEYTISSLKYIMEKNKEISQKGMPY